LRDSANTYKRQIADVNDHVEMNILHKHSLSRKDIEVCLISDISEFDISTFKDEVQALVDALRVRLED
jgi:hypothetical protein